MKKIKLILILILNLAIVPGLCLGATYYVDAKNGSDSNPGTGAQPWQTIGRAYTWYDGAGSKVQEGDTVLLRDGDYGEFIESTDVNPWGKYYFERTNWITYRAEDGCAPGLTSILIKNWSHDTWVGGSSYLTFDGITITDRISLKYTSYIKVLNCSLASVTVSFDGAAWPWYVADNYKLLSGISADHVTVQNCSFNNGYRAIHIDSNCDHWLIDNVAISDFCEVGIMSGASNCSIKNSTILNIGGSSEGAGGWQITGTITGVFDVNEEVVQAGTGATGRYYRQDAGGIYIYRTSFAEFDTDNTVIGQANGGIVTSITKLDTIHSDAIYVSDGNDVVISGNIVKTDSQGIAVYVYYKQRKRYQIENNLIYGNRTVGHYLIIEGVTDCNVINNTIIGSIGCGLYNMHDSNTVVTNMYNNIFPVLGLRNDNGGYTTQILNHGNNIFGTDPNGIGDTNKFYTNNTELIDQDFSSEYFVNYDLNSYDANGFKLLEDSPAIDFGSPGFGPDTDITGSYRDNSPDAGCYEYAASDVRPEPEADGNIVVERTSLSVFNNIIKSGGNTQAIIRCDLLEVGNLSVIVYDSKGNEIKVLFNGQKDTGRYEFTWSAADMGSGIYMVNMKIGSYSKTKKIAVIK